MTPCKFPPQLTPWRRGLANARVTDCCHSAMIGKVCERMPWYKPVNTCTGITTSVRVRVASPIYGCSVLSGDLQPELQSVVIYSFSCEHPGCELHSPDAKKGGVQGFVL